MSIGTRLKEARREAGFSQFRAAAEIGAEQSTIWKYEAGKYQPTTEMLEKLATLYNKSALWFSEDAEESESTGLPEEEGQPDKTLSTRWTLKRTGLSVELKIECNPASRPDLTYYWNASLFIRENGYIDIGSTWLQSVDDTLLEEMPWYQQAYLKDELKPIRKIGPENLEQTCSQLAKKCYNISQQAEKALHLGQEREATLAPKDSNSSPEIRMSQSLTMIDSLESKTKTLNQ